MGDKELGPCHVSQKPIVKDTDDNTINIDANGKISVARIGPTDLRICIFYISDVVIERNGGNHLGLP